MGGHRAYIRNLYTFLLLFFGKLKLLLKNHLFKKSSYASASFPAFPLFRLSMSSYFLYYPNTKHVLLGFTICLQTTVPPSTPAYPLHSPYILCLYIELVSTEADAETRLWI